MLHLEQNNAASYFNSAYLRFKMLIHYSVFYCFLQWPGRLTENTKLLSEDAKKLVNVFWQEAQGNLSEILLNDAKSYKVADINKAEGILLQIKQCFKEGKHKTIKELSNQFFDIIQIGNTHSRKMESMKDIAQKSDLCQVILFIIIILIIQVI